MADSLTLPLDQPWPGPGTAFTITSSAPVSDAETVAAISGVNNGPLKILRVVQTTPPLPIGVLGDCQNGPGVRGTSRADAGVLGDSPNGIGVKGTSANGTGIFGQGKNAGVFQGNVTVSGAININGDATVTGTLHAQAGGEMGNTTVTNLEVQQGASINGNLNVLGNHLVGGTVTANDVILPNADCAEDFDVGLCTNAEPGTVMALDERGLLQESRHAYDKKVAGVISGAGEFKPGLILGREKRQNDNHRAAVALIGKVYCKVDAQFGEISVGDLLTTSATPGHAMKADDPQKAFGSVIGKALQRMSAGQKGLIPILVALQ